MNEVWHRALTNLRGRLSEDIFESWIEPLRCDGFSGDVLKLRIPNRFYGEWINTHYRDVILEALGEAGGDETPPTSIEWEVDASLMPRPDPTPLRTPPDRARSSRTACAARTDLNPKYRFDNFVVGPSNQLAHAASVAVGSSPGRRYNPLFIYGGVGLGKTHLMNAMGHEVLRAKPDAHILYLSAERFTNEFIQALQNRRIEEFRARYRQGCDLLLMDDIQFLAGRDQTQEEFFHTFNALYHQDKQIVVTSDVYPQRIAEMEERLVSRFQSGMVADIQAPELETRMAILQQKAENENIELDQDVRLFIAQAVKSNVRELEGTLIRLAVKADLLGCPIDLAMAQETLAPILPSADRVTSVEDIQRAVCHYFSLRLSELKSKRRTRTIAFPRMLAMYICRDRLGTSYPELGRGFEKDHTTVLSAVRKITRQLEDEDPQVMAALNAIERKLA
ncbi:MAG: chromosomal replication initiator protein DnaA [Deltaproteobacteria bacterium]|nr:chromosomal replication initiator protein DnaA [Deltaproteobacteria bacterium]